MDKIVAACPMRDFVLVFTEQGKIFRVYRDNVSDKLGVVVELQLPVNPL